MTHPESDPQFSVLRQLLAEKRREIPVDTEVNRFLIELHRRQRAQLLRQQESNFFSRLLSRFAAIDWVGSPVPYAAAGALVLGLVFLHNPSNTTALISHPTKSTSLASATVSATMVQPSSHWTSHLASIDRHIVADWTKISEDIGSVPNMNFHNVAPRFVLANSRVTYDAQASF